MEKHIIGENGLCYPDLQIPEGTHYESSKYGRIKSYRPDEVGRAVALNNLCDSPIFHI